MFIPQLIITLYTSYFTPQQAIKPATLQSQINVDSIALTIVIKSYERYAEKPYYLFNGYYIGYGHRNYERFSVINKWEADSLFYADFNHFYSLFSEVRNPKLRLLLTALSFNIGPYKVKKGMIYQFAKQNKVNQFIKLYLSYNKINGKYHKGLYTRRKQELKALQLCLN